jgi:hypothetical protein
VTDKVVLLVGEIGRKSKCIVRSVEFSRVEVSIDKYRFRRYIEVFIV